MGDGIKLTKAFGNFPANVNHCVLLFLYMWDFRWFYFATFEL